AVKNGLSLTNILDQRSMKRMMTGGNRVRPQISSTLKGVFLLFCALAFGGCYGCNSNYEPSIERASCSEECKRSDVLPFLDHEDFEARLVKAREISAILEELENSRKKFLAAGNFLELFPTVYYYTTKFEFERVVANKTRYPLEKMEMIIRFFDAYKYNREAFEKGGTKAVEPHWKKYYEKAQAANNAVKFEDKYDTATEILLDGIDAHLVYDLPRFVRYFSLNSRKPIAELKEEYDALDEVLSFAAAQTDRDILNSFKISPNGESAYEMFFSGAAYLKNSRKMAWDLGVSRKPLLTKEAQPVLRHNASSTKFLPTALKEKGVCRRVNSADKCPYSGYRWFKYKAVK
ncbi:MAG: hypothetical protein KDB79_02730, partial [Acidobacteria bacterium]|nr:hypothetical protein [Acidobacteriota bacterium]